MYEDHISYGVYGIESVHCMKCHKSVKHMTEVESKKMPGKLVRAMYQTNEYSERQMEMEDGSIMTAILCNKCVTDDLDPEKIMTVVKNGWRKDLEKSGNTKDFIDEQMSKVSDKKIKKILK